MKKTLFISLLFPFLNMYGQQAGEDYVKQVKFAPGTTLEQKVEMASRLRPADRQLEWQKLELTAFLHFGINTFTDREWGDGKESPRLFNPTGLDAEQWVRALKEGGFKLVILTAKHHDGFCLWPTRTTAHSVASSPWKGGKGDVVRELKDACDKLGMKFGVYLSPWYRNAACYGDSPAYNRFFMEQLTELLTNYGTVHEVWFDGACGEGPNGKKQVYDWDAYHRLIRRLQPQAVVAIQGDDVRWVGNERGYGRETEWSATVLTPDAYGRAARQNRELGIAPKSADLGSRELLARAGELFWYPSEVDVSIRPGWFYHAQEDAQVKSLSKLVEIYLESVGRNSVLLLNVPPDRRGRLADADVARLKELGDYLRRAFADNRVKDVPYWKAAAGESKVYDLDAETTVNTLMVQEDIARGQRVEAFRLEAWTDGGWKEVAAATTVGYKRLLRIPDVRTSRLRLTVLQSRGQALISAVGAYRLPSLDEAGERPEPGGIPTAGWRVTGLPAGAAQAVDGDVQTVWRAQGLQALTVDMGQTHRVRGFVYVPVSDGDQSGTVFRYSFYTSTDGQTWTPRVERAEFSNIKNNPIPQTVSFGRTVEARYFRLVPLEEIDGLSCTSAAEVGMLEGE